MMTGRMEGEYLTDEHCYILELSNHPEDAGVSIARARVEPGITTKRHCVIDTDERYVILQGSGKMSTGVSEPRSVTAGDVVQIPAGVEQSIANIGEEDLIFICVCTPRFEWRNYRTLE